jgi:hypothetical protein
MTNGPNGSRASLDLRSLMVTCWCRGFRVWPARERDRGWDRSGSRRQFRIDVKRLGKGAWRKLVEIAFKVGELPVNVIRVFLLPLPAFEDSVDILGAEVIAESFVAILDVRQLLLGQFQDVTTLIDVALVCVNDLVIDFPPKRDSNILHATRQTPFGPQCRYKANSA